MLSVRTVYDMSCQPQMKPFLMLILSLFRCAGLRHTELHNIPTTSTCAAARPSDNNATPTKTGNARPPRIKPAPGAAALTIPAATPGAADSNVSTGEAVPQAKPAKGLKRVATCPDKLAPLAAQALVKPQATRRNHRGFLDLYNLGALLTQGRECQFAMHQHALHTWPVSWMLRRGCSMPVGCAAARDVTGHERHPLLSRCHYDMVCVGAARTC